LAALIARATTPGVPGGTLALPPGKIVAVFAGAAGAPAGAPGIAVVVVVDSV
jgi:hypothetical protein